MSSDALEVSVAVLTSYTIQVPVSDQSQLIHREYARFYVALDRNQGIEQQSI